MALEGGRGTGAALEGVGALGGGGAWHWRGVGARARHWRG